MNHHLTMIAHMAPPQLARGMGLSVRQFNVMPRTYHLILVVDFIGLPFVVCGPDDEVFKLSCNLEALLEAF